MTFSRRAQVILDSRQRQRYGIVLRLALVTLLCLALAAPPQASLAQPDEPLALLRVELRRPDDLQRVAESELAVYAYLHGVDGQEYLLCLASAEQRSHLASLSLPYHALDADAGENAYYLLPSTELARLVQQSAEDPLSPLEVLQDDGYQALARLRGTDVLTATDHLPFPLYRIDLEPITLTHLYSGAIDTSPLRDPLVDGIIEQITEATLSYYIGGLSGEWPITVGGLPYRLATRYTFSGEPLDKAIEHVSEHLVRRGWTTRYHDYAIENYALRNVIAEKRGLLYPDKTLILSAHLDSRAVQEPHDPAPGADDNASGCSVLLLAADLLGKLDLAYTVRLIFFTGEEQGMLGSYWYAHDMALAGEDILGVINLDMLAWDSDGVYDFDLHSHAPQIRDDSDALASLFAAIVGTYELRLVPQIIEQGARFSDHSRFWDQGYPAILVMEDYYNDKGQAAAPRDWNPHYHTPGDTLATLSLDMLRELASAALATAVHAAQPMRLLQGTVSEIGAQTPLSATVTAMGAQGTFHTVTGALGRYELRIPGGTYTVTASANAHLDHTISGFAILTGAVRLLDLELAPIATPTATATRTPRPTATRSATPTLTPTGTVEAYPAPTLPIRIQVRLPMVFKALRGPTPTPTATAEPLPTLPGENLIANGGFETNEAWLLPITRYSAAYSSSLAHSPPRSMRLGLIAPAPNIESHSVVQQRVTIPAAAQSVTLRAWLYPLSTESGGLAGPPQSLPRTIAEASIAGDAQYLLVLNQSSVWTHTLLWERSDVRRWEPRTFDLSSFAGRTITLQFGVYNDGRAGLTALYLDDISLMIIP
jgi:hypothetical protein